MEQTVYQQYLSPATAGADSPPWAAPNPLPWLIAPLQPGTPPEAAGRSWRTEWKSPSAAISLKTSKSVIVPNTGGLRGIETAVAAGLVSGRREKRLEVLAALEPEHHDQIRALLGRRIIRVLPAQNDELLYIEIRLWRADGVTARGILQGNHTNLTLLERDGVPPCFRQTARRDRQNAPCNCPSRRSLSLPRRPAPGIWSLSQAVRSTATWPLPKRGMEGSWGSQRRQNPPPGLRGGRPFPGLGLCSRRVRRQNERL